MAAFSSKGPKAPRRDWRCDRHLPVIAELIERPTYPAPKFWMNPDVKDFYDFKPEDFKLLDYEHGPQIKGIPVAV